jgi:hypothetical protein
MRWLDWARTVIALGVAVGFMLATSVPDVAEAARKATGPTKGKPEEGVAEATDDEAFDGVELVDVGTRDVLDRLKLLRVQMALDREEIAALELRLEKIKREREFEAVVNAGSRGVVRRTASPSSEILVKSITTAPRREAVIMYRGRIFTVRPGDRLGANLVIKDITESGLTIKSGKAGGTTTVR